MRNKQTNKPQSMDLLERVNLAHLTQGVTATILLNVLNGNSLWQGPQSQFNLNFTLIVLF